MIFDRSSGSTSPNSTAIILSTVTPGAATIESVTTAPTTLATVKTIAASPPAHFDKEATTGIAVGVSLGAAFLGVVGLLWRQKRKVHGLRKEKNDCEEKYIALLELTETLRSGNIAHTCSETQTPHELEDATIGELAS